MVVEGLDVVTLLAEHQQNLNPPTRLARTALLALPTPPICRVLHAELFASLRVEVLEEWAIELGGGDGPVPIVDLDGEPKGLQNVLDELAEHGIERLVLHGAVDQPEFASAIAFRWSGALDTHAPEFTPPTLRSSLLAPLLDDAAPLRSMGPGVIRVWSNVPQPLPPDTRVVLLAVTSDEDPVQVAAAWSKRLERSHSDPPLVRAYALDPTRSAGPWTGFVPRFGLWGSELGESARRRWSAYWQGQGERDALRQGVLGLDPVLEQWLAPKAIRDSYQGTATRAKIVVVTGADGAGKSTHATRLREAIAQAGYRVDTLKIYRQGAFLQLADELSGRTRHGAPLSAFRVSRVVKLIDSLRVYRDEFVPRAGNCDALVMDRYVETHLAAACAQLGWDLRGHPLLAPFPVADQMTWLRLPYQTAWQRVQERQDRLTADEHPAGLEGYERVFAELATPTDLVLDSRDPLADNAAAIAGRVLPAMGGCDPASAVLPEFPPAGPAPAPAAGFRKCRVRVGPGEGLPRLGESVFALRDTLDAAVPGAAAAVSERTWFEAYVAQLILDLRVLAPKEAIVPLWPAALQVLLGGELLGLAELRTMFESMVEVTQCVTDPDPVLADFVDGKAAARIERIYADAMAEIALVNR